MRETCSSYMCQREIQSECVRERERESDKARETRDASLARDILQDLNFRGPQRGPSRYHKVGFSPL